MRLKSGLLAALPALGLLAAMQIASIDDIGGRERARLRQALGTAAASLAAAIEDELFVLPSGFRISPEELSLRNWSTLKEQYAAWNAYALAPEAITSLALVDRRGRVQVWNGKDFVAAANATATTEAPADAERAAKAEAGSAADLALSAEELRAALAGLGSGPTPPWTLLRLGEDHDAILVGAGGVESGERLAVIVDRRVVSERLIPLLAERHLYGSAEYYFRVLDRRGGERVVYASDPKAPPEAFSAPDFEIPLILELPALSGPDRLTLIRREPAGGQESSARGSFERILWARRAAFLSRSSQEEAAAGSAPAKAGERDPSASGQPRLGADGLLLQAVHREGSLAAAVLAIKRRNYALSLGVLGVLAAGIAILSLSAARARRLAERQREFIAGVSHELKTPLAVIRSASENLADGLVSGEERVRSYGSALRQESGRLGDLIDRLLRFARLTAGKGGGAVEATDLRELAKELLDQYRAELTAAQFRVELSLGEEPALARVDRAGLAVALRNLVENVLRHAAEGRYLGLRVCVARVASVRDARRPSGAPGLRRAQGLRGDAPGRPRVLIRVSDRGPGIPRAERRSVFDPFVRGERARRLQVPGSGIGLGLALKIVEADGGKLRLESKPGFGSDFEISYPLAEGGQG